MKQATDLKSRLGAEKYRILVEGLERGVTQKRIAQDIGYTEQWVVQLKRLYKQEQLTK